MPIEKFCPNTLLVDIPPSERDINAVDGENVQFRNGFCSRSKGWAPYGPACPGEPHWLLNTPHAGINYWIAGADDGVYLFDGNIWTNITPAPFNPPDEYNQYTGGILNGVPVINLGCDAGNVPWYLDFSDLTALKPLPGWLPRLRSSLPLFSNPKKRWCASWRRKRPSRSWSSPGEQEPP